MGSVCKSATPLHLHKYIARFVSDSRVFLYLYVNTVSLQTNVVWFLKQNIGCSGAILLLNQQSIILWSVAVVYMQQL